MSTSTIVTHFPHLEDLPFFGESLTDTTGQTVEILRNLICADDPAQFITLKWDGSPSLVMGKDPKTNRPFVATKSIFNKVPKINFCDEDINLFHRKNPALCEILKVALEICQQSPPSHIIQGDVLFTQDDLREFIYDGCAYLGFKTNTIQYATKLPSREATHIRQRQLGIHFHRTLMGESLETLRAIYYVDPASLPEHPLLHTFNDLGSSKMELKNCMEDMVSRFGEIESQFDVFKRITSPIPHTPIKETFYRLLIQYENERIRYGHEFFHGIRYHNQLVSWLRGRYEVICERLIQRVAIARKEGEMKDLLDILDQGMDYFTRFFTLQNKISLLKEDLVTKYTENSKYHCFVSENGTLRRTGHEGLVLHDWRVPHPIKLINRYEFSRLNFLQHQKESYV